MDDTATTVDRFLLLTPQVAGRLEVLCGLPIGTLAARLDDGTATVADQVNTVAVLSGFDPSEVLARCPTIAALQLLTVQVVDSIEPPTRDRDTTDGEAEVDGG